MGRFARSWQLMKASAEVLRSDRELLWLPVLSALFSLLVVASFLVPMAFLVQTFHAIAPSASQAQAHDASLYPLLFAFYVVEYTVIFFFNTALVGAALMRMEGQDPTLRDALALAWSKLPQILGYAVIAATVGMLLRALERRMGFVGRLVVGLIGATWSVATFLVVPVLAATDVGPIDAVRESASKLRRSWGENLIGNGGIGVVFGLAIMLVVFVFGGLGLAAAAHQQRVLSIALIAVGVLALLALFLVQSALHGIYAAALYRYVEYGDTEGGFDARVMDGAFRNR